jgi:hypothetical protein
MSGPDSARDDAHPVDLGDDGTATPSPNAEVHAYLEPFLGPADEILLAATDPPPDANPVIAEFTHQVEFSIDPNGVDLKMGVREKGPRRSHFALVPIVLMAATVAAYVIGTLAPLVDRPAVLLSVFGGSLLIALVIVLIDKFAGRH